MTDLESLAEETCRDVLAARELSAICRYRGFNPPAGNKEALASFVAPRLLSPDGVARAMASLEETWLVVLHTIAMAKEPPGLGDLRAIVQPEVRSYEVDYPALFRRVADGLLSRGAVLVEDRPSFGPRGGSRFARFAFHLPEAHRPLLPPYPTATQPLSETIEPGRSLRFCRETLRSAVRASGSKRPSDSEGLLDRIASTLSFDEGRLLVGGSEARDAVTFLHRVRAAWATGGAKSLRPVFRAAEHVLSHLESGRGVTVNDLRAALSRIGRPVSASDLTRFCEDGHEAGFLAEERGCYCALPDRGDAEGDEALAFRAEKRGIEVDLERTGLGPLLELASVSRVEPAAGALRLIPDIVLLGRAAARLGSLQALSRVRGSSPAFEQAADHVERRHGKLIVHEGLVVLRVDDLGLRTSLSRRLSAGVRALGGPYLAAPRGLAEQVEKLIRKEGFSPRRMS